MSIAYESATTLAKRIRNQEIGSRELTELYIRRIEKHDGDVNAVVVRDFDRALEAADRADEAQAAGRSLGPLHGLPLTIKEAYDLEGLPTTWGVPDLAGNVARSDAVLARRLKEAGAHFVGKTNVPIHLGDFQSFNAIYGTTGNPWDRARTPGGSSGGSSAALAAGFSALEAGSDIGGSIRNPAHFCGVFGHKPTWGVVSGEGHTIPGMMALPDLAVVGPMARSAGDLALAMELVAGPDSFNARGWKLDLPAPRISSLSGLRVAVWPTESLCPVSTAVADRVQSVADALAKRGAVVSDAARPAIDVQESQLTYYSMLHGQLSGGVPEEAFAQLAKAAVGFDPADHSETIETIRATVQPHRTWARRTHHRASLRRAWTAFFEDWDVLLCPIMPTTAFPHDHAEFPVRTIEIDGEAHPYMRQLFWAGLITVAYLPSTVFPTGPAADGLPIGLQAVCAEFDDRTCIEFARLVEQELGGFQPPPGYDD